MRISQSHFLLAKRCALESLRLMMGVAIGALVTAAIVRMTQGPGTLIISQAEAVGDQFSDPGWLDIDVKVDRRRNCPTITQRYVWRWITYHGKTKPQAIPMQGTLMPFFPDDGDMILTLPNPGVPDINDKWYYRTVSAEWCGIMPTSGLNALLGTAIYKSPDRRVTFIGAELKQGE